MTTSKGTQAPNRHPKIVSASAPAVGERRPGGNGGPSISFLVGAVLLFVLGATGGALAWRRRRRVEE
ncbi:MAG: hypothetical protein M0Z95_27365 [Actinomycetota bacterium]|nr:hypothetical protein [Actinomycetota bacterium]